MNREKLTPVEILEKVALIIQDIGKGAALCGGMAAYALGLESESHITPVFTEDVDIVVDTKSKKFPLFDAKDVNLAKRLIDAGYKPELNALPTSKALPNEKWVYSDNSHYVEFLTEDHRKMTHKISGITAQGLSYFSMRLDNTIRITLPSGAKLTIVAPAAFIMHKLLTFPLRKKEAKKYKDLYYVCYVLSNGGDKSATLQSICDLNIHPKWKDTARNNLKNVMDGIGLNAKRISQADDTGWLTEFLTTILLNEINTSLTQR